jgi:hypothetical protein
MTNFPKFAAGGSFRALMPRGCTIRRQKLRRTNFDYNVQYYIHHRIIHTSNGSHPPMVLRALQYVKDVRPATRRRARRARLSFPKVPNFCSLESPGHITHINNVVPGGRDAVAYLHLINSQLRSWASAQVSARSSAQYAPASGYRSRSDCESLPPTR